MRSKLCVIFLSVILLMPALTIASVTPSPLKTSPVAYSSDVTPEMKLLSVDEDSIYYQYGFENGWSGWTTADLTNPGVKWLTTDEHAFEGNSWWCADEVIGGYDNHWLQYLMTPVLDLSGQNNLRLNFKLFWAVEDPAAGEAPPQPYDGWDGCNVWISIDGGDNWQVLTPNAPAYTHSSLYSFGEEWGMGAGIPGWCANSDRWLDADFDLSNYARSNVRIRWAFCSDPGWSTADDANAIGMLVDNLRISAGEQVIWSNNGDDQGDMEFDIGPVSGDFWEISQANRRFGRYSAHCPVQPNLQNALVSPPIEVPGEGWYTWFDFWVLPDMRVSDSNNDGYLDDYFRVEISTDDITWEQIVYDYGRNDDWLNFWQYYGPDVTFRNDFPEWKRKLNLTQFAGQTIKLRWVMRTDDVMTGNPGTGLWIDDVRINITSRRENDVGVFWLRVNYPTSIGFASRCQMAIRNYGMVSQQRVTKYYRVENGPLNPVVPWDELQPDSIKIYPFALDVARIPFADSLSIFGITTLNNDQNVSNDVLEVPDIVFYPAGVNVLGYDNRSYRYRYNLDRGHGALTYFTPLADGVRGSFDLKALRVRWNGQQNVPVDTRLHIYADNGGEIGQEIHSGIVNVTLADVIPNIHVIDLSGVQALQGLSDNFWVWFEILRDESWPQIIGDEQKFGAGHYFSFDGTTKTAMNADFMVHAVLMLPGTSGTNLVAGRDRLDYGNIMPGTSREMRVALFNSGTNPVTIESVSSSSARFVIDRDYFQTPMTLKIGDVAHLWVVFTPNAEGEFTGEITFVCNDNTPPVVQLLGVGDINAGVSLIDEVIPGKFELGNAFPNPFNAITTIPFSLPLASKVKLAVYDLSGRQIALLADGFYSAGRYSLSFNAGKIPAGIYLYQLEAGDYIASSKFVLVK